MSRFFNNFFCKSFFCIICLAICLCLLIIFDANCSAFFLFSFLRILNVKRLFDGLKVLENSRKFAYPPKVGCKITYFGGLAQGRNKMAQQRHLDLRFWSSPSTRFDARLRHLEGVCNRQRRTKKPLGAIVQLRQEVRHLASKIIFGHNCARFHTSYLNELLLELSSYLFETCRVCS